MQLACKDVIQRRIVEEIRKRENILLNTYKTLQATANDNEIFQSVLDDYEKYYDNIKEQKEKQSFALKNISDYLENKISETSDLNNQEEILKDEQRQILTKLDKLRNELDEIAR
jgi:translation initiation factor 2B subunit (eIF-2B alpha/beta/delta family)